MNLGGGEVLVILLVALLVLGPTRLPEAARQVGKAMRTVRQVSTGFQDEMRHAIEDTIEADAAKDAGVSHTPASRPGARRPAPVPEDDRPDPGGPTDLTAEDGASSTESPDPPIADAAEDRAEDPAAEDNSSEDTSGSEDTSESEDSAAGDTSESEETEPTTRDETSG